MNNIPNRPRFLAWKALAFSGCIYFLDFAIFGFYNFSMFVFFISILYLAFLSILL